MSTAGRWERVLAAGGAAPDLGRDAVSIPDATAELTVLLGSIDPHERDVAYGLLSTWLERGYFDDLLVGLGDGMCVGLRTGLGDERSGSVFRRSTSALLLAGVVERDNVAQVVHPSHVLRWADLALHWFVAERDLRGHTGTSGWAFAVAHGADLVTALGMSRHLGADELGVLLDAIADRLARSSAGHLVHGEDDRLAYATTILLHRDLVEPDFLAGWMTRLVTPFGLDVTGPYGAAHANTRQYLRALHLMLRFGVAGGMPWHRHVAERLTREPLVRLELLQSVEDALRRYHPGLYREPDRSPGS